MIPLSRKLSHFTFSLAYPLISQDPSQHNNKKAKKVQFAKSPGNNVFDVNDRAALDRRAARFAREHQIEAQKTMKGSTSNTWKNARNAHIYDHSRPASPFVDSDDPEADPVSTIMHH